MRSLSWVAILCLQIGIFTCSMGVDVCQAADDVSHIVTSQSNDSHDSSLIDTTCVAHAAHVFVGLSMDQNRQPDVAVEKIRLFVSLTLPEILHAIEHPPQLSQS